MGTISDADSIAKIFVNTNMAAAAGVVIAVIYMQLRYGKIDVTMALNGALAGLVAITAEPLTPSVPAAMLVGALGSLLAMLTVPLLDKFKIDDVVVSFMPQLIGVIATAVFVSVISAIIWFAMKATIGIRVSEEVELDGLDAHEIGVAAYPEFVQA